MKTIDLFFQTGLLLLCGVALILYGAWCVYPIIWLLSITLGYQFIRTVVLILTQSFNKARWLKPSMWIMSLFVLIILTINLISGWKLAVELGAYLSLIPILWNYWFTIVGFFQAKLERKGKFLPHLEI